MYDLRFTSRFKSGVERLQPHLWPVIDRQLDWLSVDPFSYNANATRMQGVRRKYRMRINQSIRMLYQVDCSQMTVCVQGIGTHDEMYRNTGHGGRELATAEAERFRKRVRGKIKEVEEVFVTGQQGSHSEADNIEIEEIDWICEDELFLLHIPREEWGSILEAGDYERLDASAISEASRSLLLDYLTTPAPNQIERLYSLGRGQGVTSIAKLPLSKFLVALDPDQSKALESLKQDGPYLLKGAAGTGKSLVGMYYIRGLMETAPASGETYGVISYTNVLVDVCRQTMSNLMEDQVDQHFVCETLDKQIRGILELASPERRKVWGENELAKWVNELRVNSGDDDTAKIIERLGAGYIAEELERFIIGCAIREKDHYLQVERRGRGRGLNKNERQVVWAIFERFIAMYHREPVTTWAMRRAIALRYLKEHPEYPRFAGLFVDEAQDLSKVSKMVCLELVEDPRKLLMAADTGQSIYALPMSWKQTDPRFDFRRRRPILLSRGYRSTKEISKAISPLRHDPGDELDRCSEAEAVYIGPNPIWIEESGPVGPKTVCREISKLLTGEDAVNAGRIAVIARERYRCTAFAQALRNAGIEATFVDKDSPLDPDGNVVSILTAHSSKGLGFPVVFVVDVSGSMYPSQSALRQAQDDEQRQKIIDNDQRTLYVALSRAGHRLYMVVDKDDPSPFIQKLDRAAHWQDRSD